MLYKKHRHLALLSALLTLSLATRHARADAPPPLPDKTGRTAVPEPAAPLSFIPYKSGIFTVGGTFGSDPTTMQVLDVSAGYQWNRIALDLRFGAGVMNYGSISVAPGSADIDTSSEAGDPASELLRPRANSDRWTYLQVEPGISIVGQLFADQFPRLSERGRFGVGMGSFYDQANSINFTAFLYSFEGDLEYQLAPRSHWALRLGLAFDSGVLNRSGDLWDPLGRLPVSWIKESVSILYSL